MNKINHSGHLLLLVRVMLAILGGYILTSVLVAAIPIWLNQNINLNKTSVFLWMMLSSFAIYTGLILWIVASKRLLRTSIILLALSAGSYVVIEAASTTEGEVNVEKQ